MNLDIIMEASKSHSVLNTTSGTQGRVNLKAKKYIILEELLCRANKSIFHDCVENHYKLYN